MVGTILLIESVTNKNEVLFGGSSKIFNKAFADSAEPSDNACASKITTTFLCPDLKNIFFLRFFNTSIGIRLLFESLFFFNGKTNFSFQ